MSEKKSIEKRLIDSLAKESKKFAQKESKLSETYSKLSKAGIDTKSTYSLPLKDTIGKTFREQIQFNSL
ncbi:MAG: hypothetical protein AAGH81_14105 [Bacteroidota bacterium]